MNTNFITNRLRNAVRSAFDKTAQVSGVENDPNMRIYQSLQQDDFNDIMKKYGVENTMKYITTMESKRMMKPGGQNGEAQKIS